MTDPIEKAGANVVRNIELRGGELRFTHGEIVFEECLFDGVTVHIDQWSDVRGEGIAAFRDCVIRSCKILTDSQTRARIRVFRDK